MKYKEIKKDRELSVFFIHSLASSAPYSAWWLRLTQLPISCIKPGDLCQLDRMLRIFKFLQDHSCPFSDQNTMLFGMIGITHDT